MLRSPLTRGPSQKESGKYSSNHHCLGAMFIFLGQYTVSQLIDLTRSSLTIENFQERWIHGMVFFRVLTAAPLCKFTLKQIWSYPAEFSFV